MPLNFELAGKEYAERKVTVEGDRIEMFARATNDLRDAYLAGDPPIAPPVFPVVPAFPIMVEVTGDAELGVERTLDILHGAQEFRYHRPIRAGDVLFLRPVLESVDDKGRGATFVVRIEARDEGEEPVVDQWWTIFVRGAGTGGARRRGSAEETVHTDLVATFGAEIDEDMPARYAEASGDHNPIHLSEEVARAAGLPGVINHGLGTLAVVSSGLVDHAAKGDPELLRRLFARFTAPVSPGTKLTTDLWRSEEPALMVYRTTRPDDRTALAGEVEVST